MATMPTLPETQESIKEEIRRQVSHRTETQDFALYNVVSKFLQACKTCQRVTVHPKKEEGRHKNMVVFVVVLLIYGVIAQ